MKINTGRWKTLLGLFVPVLISAALLYWVLRDLEHPEVVWRTIREASYVWLLVAFPLELGSHYVRALRWRRFIGERKVPAYFAFSSVMIGYAVNGLWPRGGEIARIVNMNRTTGVKVAHLLATVVTERLIDVLTLMLLLGVTLILVGDRLAQCFPSITAAVPLGLAMVVGGFSFVLVFAFQPRRMSLLLGRLGYRVSEGLGKKTEELVRQANRGFAFLRSPKQVGAVILETAASWGLHWLSFVFVVIAFGFWQYIGLQGSVVIFSITSASAVVPSAGAIGAFHKLGVDSFVLLYKTEAARALGFVSVLHLLAYYVVPFGSGFVLWLGQGLITPDRLLRSGEQSSRHS